MASATCGRSDRRLPPHVSGDHGLRTLATEVMTVGFGVAGATTKCPWQTGEPGVADSSSDADIAGRHRVRLRVRSMYLFIAHNCISAEA